MTTTYSQLEALRKQHGSHVEISTTRPDGFTFSSRVTISPESGAFWGQIIGTMGLTTTVWDDRPLHRQEQIQVYLIDGREKERAAVPSFTGTSASQKISEADAAAFADAVTSSLYVRGWSVLSKNNADHKDGDVHWGPQNSTKILELGGHGYKDISSDRKAIKESIQRNVLSGGILRDICKTFLENGRDASALYSLQEQNYPTRSSLSSGLGRF